MYLGSEQVTDLLRHAASVLVLGEFHRNDVHGHELVATQHRQSKLGPDLRLHHQALEVALLVDRDIADRNDHVAPAQGSRRGRTPSDDLLNFYARLPAEAMRGRGRQWPGAPGDAEERSADASVTPHGGKYRLRG